jgi:hypothetical protein
MQTNGYPCVPEKLCGQQRISLCPVNPRTLFCCHSVLLTPAHSASLKTKSHKLPSEKLDSPYFSHASLQRSKNVAVAKTFPIEQGAELHATTASPSSGDDETIRQHASTATSASASGSTSSAVATVSAPAPFPRRCHGSKSTAFRPRICIDAPGRTTIPSASRYDC